MSEVPTGAGPASEIHDRYLLDTSLRLRRIESESGVTFKLGQKIRRNEEDPGLVMITNIYLTEIEHAALTLLPGRELTKIRRLVDVGGSTFAIDEFSGRLAGLILAETELQAADPPRRPPPGSVKEVTDDDRFSGGGLAFATAAGVVTVLDEARGR